MYSLTVPKTVFRNSERLYHIVIVKTLKVKRENINNVVNSKLPISFFLNKTFNIPHHWKHFILPVKKQR